MKLQVGDIFELETKKGKYIYFQCVDIPQDKKNDIELIKAYYDLYDEKQTDLISVTKKDYFFNKFPLSSALRKKIIYKVVDLSLLKDFKIPLYFRIENPFGNG